MILAHSNFVDLILFIYPSHCDLPNYLTALALDLVKKLLIVDPKARFTTEEALRHPWLQVCMGQCLPA